MPSRAADAAERLGLAAGQLVGEFGGSEADDDFRGAVEAAVGSPILDGGADEVFDVLLVWWRADDGDLTDELVDGISALDEDGTILLLVPRAGHDGYVDVADIEDAAEVAGLPRPTTGPTLDDWSIVKLARTRGSGKVRR